MGEVIRTTGRVAVAVPFEIEGPITAEDLTVVETEKGSRPPPLKEIRSQHHRLAMLIAQGATNAEVALATGYSPSRISILKADPAFEALISDYRGDVREVFRDLTEKMLQTANMANDEIIARLDTAPEDIPMGQLLEIQTKMADRAGFGPTTKSMNTTVNVSLAGRLESARRRAAMREFAGPLVEGSVNEESIA